MTEKKSGRGGRRPGAGRKPSATAARTVQHWFRVTVEEDARIRAVAGNAVGAWEREAILAAVVRAEKKRGA